MFLILIFLSSELNFLNKVCNVGRKRTIKNNMKEEGWTWLSEPPKRKIVKEVHLSVAAKFIFCLRLTDQLCQNNFLCSYSQSLPFTLPWPFQLQPPVNQHSHGITATGVNCCFLSNLIIRDDIQSEMMA